MKSFSTLLLITITFSCFAQYPSSFSWQAASGKDQKVIGPCHIFATVSAAETWYRLLYGFTPELSQAHLYSPCASMSLPSTSIDRALNFLRDYGVVDGSFLLYKNNNPPSSQNSCTTSGNTEACDNEPREAPNYFHQQIFPTNPNLISCSMPWQNCTVNNGLPGHHFKIAGWAEVPIASYTSTDQVKRAILNYGPIALWMEHPSLHGGRNHAYCLYGWNTNNQWLLTDSWPCAAGTTSTSLNLVTLFQSNQFFKAYRLVNTPTRPAIFRETRSGTSWVYDNAPTTCPELPNTPFSISGNNVITSSPTIYSISNISLLDNPSIEWSFISGGGTVSHGSTTNLTFTVTGTASGSGTIKAKIKRPNGLCETITKAVSVSVQGGSIPFTYTKIQDLCVAGKRKIVYQVTCNNGCPISCAWDFRPSPGGSYTTSINGCTFTVNYSSFNTSYGLLVSVTSSSYPGVTGHGTAGGSVMPCAPTGFRKPNEDINDLQIKGSAISVYPNPVRQQLNILLPNDDVYVIKLINAMGRTIFTSRSSSAIVINVAKYNRGLYFVQLIPFSGKTEIVTRKVLLE